MRQSCTADKGTTQVLFKKWLPLERLAQCWHTHSHAHTHTHSQYILDITCNVTSWPQHLEEAHQELGTWTLPLTPTGPCSHRRCRGSCRCGSRGRRKGQGCRGSRRLHQPRTVINRLWFFNVGTPCGVHLLDHLPWSIFQSSITHYNFFKFLNAHSASSFHELPLHLSFWLVGRDSGNDFGRFSVSFFEGRISYIRIWKKTLQSRS